METRIDIARLIDEQRIGAFTIRLVAISFVIMLADGYDLLAASYGAPGLIAAWHVKAAQLGPVFSASPFGMVLGAPLMGWLGDRYGRRITVIFGTVLFGAFSILCAMATNVHELMILRFVTGVGLGGMLPNITALNAEFAPIRIRATLIVIMFMGVTVGSTLPALVVAAVPHANWRTLYWIGGLAPLALAVLLAVWLPESLKFLNLKQTPKARAALERTASQIFPQLAVGHGAIFVARPERPSGAPVAELFRGGLGWITPLLWLLFFTNLTGNYFLYNWMPVLFRSAGFSSANAALTTACYYVGGFTGGLTVSRFIDRKGFLPVAVFFALGVPAVACIGIPGLPTLVVAALVFLSGFCVLGVQLGINAAAGLIYPTPIRATGVGWAFGLGRIGGIAGPMLGAVLISMKLSPTQLFLAPAVPLALGAVACIAFVKLYEVRFRGGQFGEGVLPAAARN